jgi:hypothetical protein
MDSAASAQATRLERFAAHLNLLRVHSHSSVFPGGAPLYFGTIAGNRGQTQNSIASMLRMIYERSLAEPV